MEEGIVEMIYTNSQLDIFGTVHNLLAAIQTRIEGGFDYTSICVYCQNLNLLKTFINCIINHNVIAPNYCVKGTCKEIIDKVCWPFLIWASPSYDSRKDVLMLLGSICKLTATCAASNNDVMLEVIQHVLCSVDTYIMEKPTSSDLNQKEGLVDVYSQCEILRHVLQQLNYNPASFKNSRRVLHVLSEIFSKLIQAVDLVSFDTVGSVVIPALTKTLEIHQESLTDHLYTIWTSIQTFSRIPGEKKQFLLLCGFANFFFPVTFQPIGRDIRREDCLWKILQNGLLSKDSLNRKRCLYLVKRIIDICEKSDCDIISQGDSHVFSWITSKKKELSKIWEDFMLLAEVFEEKQVLVLSGFGLELCIFYVLFPWCIVLNPTMSHYYDCKKENHGNSTEKY